MKSFTYIIVILLLGFSSLIQAQAFYAHTPIGKETFEVSDQLILLHFKKQIPTKAKQQLLANEPFIVLPKDQSWGPGQLTILDLKGQPTASQIQRMAQRLSENAIIDYASPFLTTAKGGFVAPSDRVIVGLKKSSDRELLDQQSEHFGIKRIVADTFLQNICYLKVPASQSLTIANQLHESGQFEFAEVDFVSLVENNQTADPLLSDQWGLQNTPQGMNVMAAWEYTTGSPSIKVAILDTGVKLNHEDLKNNLVIPGYDATDQAGREQPGGAKSGDAHGTNCAGVVAAEANNGIGIAGVAFNVRIVPIRISYDERPVYDERTGRWSNQVTSTFSWAAAGINQAVRQEVDILSNSWSSPVASYLIEVAVNNASLNGRNGKGCLVFFSSNNKGEDEISAIARIERAFAVGSTTASNVRANNSSYGPGLDLVAPGVDIQTTAIDGGFETVSGTSFACPNAAAVMALILSVNPDLTYSQARFVLESTCDKPGTYEFTNNPVQPNGTWNSNVGHGVVNAERAVALACSMRGGCEPIETHCFNAEWIEGDGTYHANPSFGNGARQNSAAHSAWFRFRAPVDGEINIDACGSGINTRLFVYTGACDNIADVANSDSTCVESSMLQGIRVEAGRDYFIEWDSYHSSAPFLFRFGFKPLVSPNRIYVDGNRSSSGATTGTSWSTAVRDLQDALTLARSSDETTEIWVADGLYKPSQDGDRTRSFELINGVSMYGGFQGWESQLSQRNLNASLSTLSGDIGYSFYTLDNSYSVVSAINVNANTRLDGFVITEGSANGFADAYQDWDTKRAGAGIYIEAKGLGAVSEPTIENCRLDENVADFGGAIAIHAWQKGNCQPRFVNCSATGNEGQVGGAFLYVRTSFESRSTPYFENCTFNNNSTLKGGAYLQTVDGHCRPLFNRCVFRLNEAIHGGGAIYNFVDQGGNGEPTFTNCLFDKNTAPNGSSYGGAMLNVAVDGVLQPRVLNCTFVDNYALHQGGAIFNHNVNSVALIEMTVSNSIFYRNTTSAGEVMRAAGNRVFLDLRNNYVDRIDCNSTTAGTGTVRHCANMVFTTENPFNNIQGLDFSLKPSSLAVNAGSNEAILSIPQAQQDLLGSNRIEEGRVDIGALESVGQQGFEICDDFESYIPSNISPQAAHWTKWSPQAPDAEVSNWRAATGQQSLHLMHQSSPTIKPDVLYNLGDQIRGQFSLGWKQYVSGNKRAYFNLQKFQNDPGEEYGFECYFLSGGRGRIKTGGRYDDFFYTYNNWLDIELHFDLERNWVNFFIDDNLIYGWPLSNTSRSTNGTRQLGAINFYAITNADFYIDDICFSEAGDNLQSSLNQRASVPVPSQVLDHYQPKHMEEATAEVLPLQWKIFPNPAKDHVWIQSGINTDDPIQVAIFDATGKQLRHYQSNNFNGQGFQMDLSGLVPGTYFVRLTHAAGQETKSLVVIP